MKKIKTINKLLSSLTLLSPLAGIGFNNQHQNTQKVITEDNNNSLNNYVTNQTNAEQRKMGDITVNVEGTVITGYAEGTGTLQVASNITEIANNAFYGNENITSLDLSQATSLTTISNNAFRRTKITSLDLSQATNLTTIENSAFESCSKLAGDLVIRSNVKSIGNLAFRGAFITSLDLSKATSLTSIGDNAFDINSNITGELIFSSSVTSIGEGTFSSTARLDNIYFLSETPPTFGSLWQPTVTGKVYVPSEAAKQAYLDASNFGFSRDQVEIGLPPESKSNTGLILGLVFGLGIPILLAIGFAIWYLSKKKKTTVKI